MPVSLALLLEICAQNHKTEIFPRENALYQEPMTLRLMLIPHARRTSIVSLDNNTTLGIPLCKNAGYAPGKRISLIFELREICLSLQMVLSLASAAVVCSILDSTSDLEP